MPGGILGKKIGMTRIVSDDGRVIPLTIIQCEPNVIAQIKTVDKDGYPAVVLGFEKLKKPSKNKTFRFKSEFRIPAELEAKTGEEVKVDIFEENEVVKVTGWSKGKGFQGVIKRHNFSRGPETHGSHHHRKPGSIGACAKPGRVYKGRKLPGRMGGDKVTLRNTSIVYIDQDKNLIGIKGAVPGARDSLVVISKTTNN